MMKKYIIISLISMLLQVSIIYAKGKSEPTENATDKKTEIKNTVALNSTIPGKIDIIYTTFWSNPDNKSINFDNSNNIISQNDIMQIIINRINNQNHLGNIIFHPKFDIRQSYYEQLESFFSEHEKDNTVILPDLMLLTNTKLAEYYQKNYLEEIYSKDLTEAGIDLSDWNKGLRTLGSFNNKIYGIPLGFDMLVWYINLELFKQADLLGKDNLPIVPKNMGELVIQANQFYKKTGKPYLGIDASGSDGIRTLLTLYWQFNTEIISILENGELKVTLNTIDVRLISEDFIKLFSSKVATSIDSSIQLQSQFVNDNMGVIITSVAVKERINLLFQNKFKREVEEFTKQKQQIDNSENLEDRNKEIIIPTTKKYVTITPFPTLYGDQYIVWGTNNLITMRKGLRTQNPTKYKVALDLLNEIDSYKNIWESQILLSAHYSTLFDFEIKNNIEDHINFNIDNNYRTQLKLKELPPIASYNDVMRELRNMLKNMLVNSNDIRQQLHQTELSINKIFNSVETAN